MKLTEYFFYVLAMMAYYIYIFCYVKQEEQEKIRSQKGEDEPLLWTDYKSMPFTQCVCSFIFMFIFRLSCLILDFKAKDKKRTIKV